MLTQEAVEEFKALYLGRFGIRLGDEEATEQAVSLLNLYRLVYGPQANMKKEMNHERPERAR